MMSYLFVSLLVAVSNLFYNLPSTTDSTHNNIDSVKYNLVYKYDVGGNGYEFGNIKGVAVDHKNRVYVSDLFDFGINIFDQNGQLLDKIANRGRGPSEFLKVSDFAVDSQNIYILDNNLFKLLIYDIDNYAFVKSLPLQQFKNSTKHPSMPTEILADVMAPNNMIVIYSIPFAGGTGNIVRQKTLYHIKPDFSGEVLDIPVKEDDYYIEDRGNGISVTDLPFMRKSLVRFYDSQLYVNWTEDFSFSIYNLKSYLLVEKRYEAIKRPVDLKSIDSNKYDYLKEEHKKSIQKFWPAIDNFFIKGEKIFSITNVQYEDKYQRALLAYDLTDNKKPEIWCILPDNIEIVEFNKNTIFGIVHEGLGYKLSVYQLEERL